MDNLREAFTFDTKNVCSYELGKARHKREASYDTDLGAQNSKILEKLELVQQSVRDMETEIRKVSTCCWIAANLRIWLCRFSM